jgi:hypothetical protein
MKSFELYDPVRVARMLRVQVDTLAAWRKRNYGPRWYRIGKKVMYAERELHKWMSGQVSPQCSDAVRPKVSEVIPSTGKQEGNYV